MRLGIDATNIISGGGLTHLVAFIEDALENARYQKLVVWSSRQTIERLPAANAKLEYRTNDALNSGIVKRVFWTTFYLAGDASDDIDVLFVPGGLYLGRFRPFLTMCRNMLPFDAAERQKFGFSAEGIRLRLLAVLQGRTFARADKLVFLSRYAQDEINSMVRLDRARQFIIPHGIADTFRQAKADYDGSLSSDAPRFLYISTLSPYKYQLELVDAVARLRALGKPVSLDLVGSGYPAYQQALMARIKELGVGDLVRVHGHVAHGDLPALYAQSDAALYASGCENFPNILVEAMASGLPVLSSSRGPMPEILEDTGLYFDPAAVDSIVAVVSEFIDMSAAERWAMAQRSSALSERYSWPRSFELTQQQLDLALAG